MLLLFLLLKSKGKDCVLSWLFGMGGVKIQWSRFPRGNLWLSLIPKVLRSLVTVLQSSQNTEKDQRNYRGEVFSSVICVK